MQRKVVNAGQSKDHEEDPEQGDSASEAGKEDSDVSPSATASQSEIQNRQTESVSPSRQAQKVSKQQTQATGLAALIQFIGEALIELKKINWPDRQQVIKETLSVIVLVAIITACVLAFDYGIAKVVFEPLDKLARHLGGGIGVHH